MNQSIIKARLVVLQYFDFLLVLDKEVRRDLLENSILLQITGI